MFIEFSDLFAGPCNFALKSDLSINDFGQPQFSNHFRSSFYLSATFCSSDTNTKLRFAKLKEYYILCGLDDDCYN